VTTDSTTLYRPVGQKEFDLVRASGYREFPPRLPEQPFFYPVLNEDYATQIARDWNTKDEGSGFTGYVLRFSVRNEFLNRYEIHVVGDSIHREYWIPAAELVSLNTNIVGSIEVVSEFRRKKWFRGRGLHNTGAVDFVSSPMPPPPAGSNPPAQPDSQRQW
jgi:hypothetical protein